MNVLSRSMGSALLTWLAIASLPIQAVAHESGRTVITEGSSLEIPAFARKYGFTCAVCHSPIPRLTEFGEVFAANGFQLAENEQPRDTIETGDPLLRLVKNVPLALRFDGYAQGNTSGEGELVSNDLSFPYGIKLLSGGPIADHVSYYMYFFLSERGEIAGLEDAYLQFTDIGGSGVGVMLGQFQISDPLFKRELRLEFEDYQLYRMRIGDARADLTYDRGLMVPFSLWENGDWVLGAVNGSGIGEASEARTYDRDDSKNFFARYSHSFGPIRIGAFGFYGDERANDVSDVTWYWGPDLTVALGDWGQLNAEYLRRTDTHPFFDTAGAPVDTWANSVMAEIIWWPAGAGGRWFVSGLWNWIDASDPIVSLRIDEQVFIQSYNFISVDATHLFARNIRFTGEVGVDTERDNVRIVLGVVSGF